MGYVYLITNIINGKKYVGQSCCEDINHRWNEHKSCKKSSLGVYIYNAYKKHGIKNFKYQIICVCFDEDCDNYEREYIKKFNTLAPNGYNLTEGGRSVKHSKETRALISQNVKKSMPERIEKIKQYYKEHDHPTKGKKLSEEHKKKVGEKQKEYWANLTEEQRDKISQERKARINNTQMNDKCKMALENGRHIGSESLRKKVGKYTMNDEFIESYSSISEASEKNNIVHSSISKTCRGVFRYKSAGGFKWKYIE